jgi:WD40 repeat protein
MAYADNAYAIHVYKINEQGPQYYTTLYGNTNDLLSLAFSPEGRLLASANSEGIRIYDLTLQKMIFFINHKLNKQCHEGPVSTVTFKSEELLFSGGHDTDIKVYSICQNQAKTQDILNMQKDTLCITQNDYTLTYIDGYNAHKGRVNGIRFPYKESNLMASFAEDGDIKIYDITKWLNKERGINHL